MNYNSNIEIKARINDRERIRRFLLDEGADFKGKDHQTDIYFNVKNGRLKIREGTIENCVVHYQRPDQAGPKRCEYTILKYERQDPDLLLLKKILTDSSGILVIVEKYREIYFIDNVKFHIDNVLGLGTFFEIEIINNGVQEEPELRGICESYLKRMGIDIHSLLSNSYSDMILGNEPV